MEDHWHGIDPKAAHSIEYSNYRAVVELVESMVTYKLFRHGGAGSGCPEPLTNKDLKLLHQIATLFLLPEPGVFRTKRVQVKTVSGLVVLAPPHWQDVPAYMTSFENDLASIWVGPTLECAAFALWRVNWIHPFLNGNGRTARAFTYAVICLRFGGMLKTEPSIIEKMDTTRERYYNCLTIATDSLTYGRVINLGPMVDYLGDLIEVKNSCI